MKVVVVVEVEVAMNFARRNFWAPKVEPVGTLSATRPVPHAGALSGSCKSENKVLYAAGNCPDLEYNTFWTVISIW